MITEHQQKEKLKVVLDTNVYISIFTSPRGELGAIWEHAIKRTYTLLISPEIVAEVANVLRDKFMWPEPEIKARVKRFARMADIITPTIVPNVIENDPADNHILACAVSGKAQVIVSGDKRHLLPLKEYEGIPIVRPVDFLRMLGGL
jgi:putative PIN family toxin of toxin-antitoxin system